MEASTERVSCTPVWSTIHLQKYTKSLKHSPPLNLSWQKSVVQGSTWRALRRLQSGSLKDWPCFPKIWRLACLRNPEYHDLQILHDRTGSQRHPTCHGGWIRSLVSAIWSHYQHGELLGLCRNKLTASWQSFIAKTVYQLHHPASWMYIIGLLVVHCLQSRNPAASQWRFCLDAATW